MKNKLIKEYISKTKKPNYERIYISNKDLDKTNFSIGKKYSYQIDFKNKSIKIVPYLKNDRSGKGTVSHKKETLQVIDIFNIKLLSQVFKGINTCKISIHENEIIITTENGKFSIDKKAFLNKFNHIYNLNINNDFYSNQASYSHEFATDIEVLEKVYTLASLFSGMGGFDVGFINQGFKPYFALDKSYHKVCPNNIDKYGKDNCDILEDYHIQTYKENIGDHIVDADITTFDFHNVNKLFPNNECDVLIGGPPCTEWSVRNNNRPKDIFSPKKKLVLEYIRAIKEIKPKIFVMENVKQVLTNGKFFIDHMKETLKDYVITTFKLKSSNYNSAQKRERAIVIGSSIGEINIETPTSPPYVNIKSMFLGLNDDIPNQTEYPAIGELMKERLRHLKPGQCNLDLPSHLKVKYKSYLERLSWTGQTGTIDNVAKRYLIHPSEDRVVSIREVLRLQGFDDNFIPVGTIRAKYQMLANAVPVNLAEVIAEKIREKLNRYYLSIE